MRPVQKSRFMKVRAAVAALGLLVLTAPGVRATDVGGGCGGTWHATAPKVCTFNFRGFPITISADARVASGTAHVHVWVTVEGFEGNVVYECRASAALYANCNQGMLDVGEDIDERWVPFHLRCHVEGNGSSAYPNAYYCKSAKGF